MSFLILKVHRAVLISIS